jgi:hypothetical protein
MPSSRIRLLLGLAEHIEGLADSSGRIGEAHRAEAESLAGWISKNYRSGV